MPCEKLQNVCVCVCVWECVKGWAHSAQSALPFFTPVGKTPLSKTWLNGCIALSLSPAFWLSLSLPPLLILSVSASHVSTNQCSMLPSPPCSPAKRESHSRHHHCQRDGPRTQIGRDTQREGGEERGREDGGKKKCTCSHLPTPLSCLFFLKTGSLRLKSGGEEARSDIEFVTRNDSW